MGTCNILSHTSQPFMYEYQTNINMAISYNHLSYQFIPHKSVINMCQITFIINATFAPTFKKIFFFETHFWLEDLSENDALFLFIPISSSTVKIQHKIL